METLIELAEIQIITNMESQVQSFYFAYFDGYYTMKSIQEVFDKVNDFYFDYPDRFDSKAFKIAFDIRKLEIEKSSK